MSNISKMLGAGFGAALAKTILMFLPIQEESQRQAVEYVIYTLITMICTYVSPPNSSETKS